ncbi:hypothetical protein [Trichoplusia ni ascovirus 6b]|nr:hypothetical protein [Trichoplusia ni ascovirus 6b]
MNIVECLPQCSYAYGIQIQIKFCRDKIFRMQIMFMIKLSQSSYHHEDCDDTTIMFICVCICGEEFDSK